VVTFRGKLIESYYHAACGGWTQDNEDSWGGSPLSYLRGVRCGYCADSPNFLWSCTLSFDQIQRALLEKGHKVSTITRIHAENCPESGRAVVIIVESSRGSLRLLSNQFRLAVGTDVVRSAFFICPQQTVTCQAPGTSTDASSPEELKMRSIIGHYLSQVNNPCELKLEGSGLGHGVGLCQSGARTLADLEKKSYAEILAFYYLGTDVETLY
jgi:stage II sporulation protein D